MEDARRAAERVARDSYGRLVALLSRRSGDIAGAEDALADAFRAALDTWPARGVPDRPEAWLLTAARRVLGHAHRHAQVRARGEDVVSLLHEELADSAGPLPDARLALLFVCAHPAIDPGVRTPLMLQTVLGLDAARIAAAFLTAPAAMAQRLVRAKTKVKAARVPFELPDPERLGERLTAVLDAIYAAFGTAWDEAPGGEGADGLAEEAVFLARLLVDLLPDEPECKGLLALLLYCAARSAARRGADGIYVPLAEQDVRLWSRPLIVEAEALLRQASAAARFGRYQTEAALQSLHIVGRVTGRVDREARLALYDVLLAQAPSIGAQVARAAALTEARGPPQPSRRSTQSVPPPTPTNPPGPPAPIASRWRGIQQQRRKPMTARSGSAATRPCGIFWRSSGRRSQPAGPPRSSMTSRATFRKLAACSWINEIGACSMLMRPTAALEMRSRKRSQLLKTSMEMARFSSSAMFSTTPS